MHKIDVISMGGWIMQGLSGMSHAGVGFGGSCRKIPKNDSPRNQDLTPPKSILEKIQNLSFEYKNYNYYLLLQLFYIHNYIKKLLSDVPCIKITMA